MAVAHLHPVARVVALLVALVGCGLEPPDSITIRRAAMIADASPTPPPDDDPRWRDVMLPDRWRGDRRVAEPTGWYRLTFDLAGRPDDLWAVALPIVVQNVAVLVNGEPVGDGGPFAPRMARNWNRPLLFTIPPALLRTGRNVVDLRVASAGVAPPALGLVHVGPATTLTPVHDRRMMLQVGLARTTTVTAVVLIALLALLLRRGGYFVGGQWFVVMLALLTLTSFDNVLHEPPLPPRAWDWLVAVLRSAAVACSVMGAHRHLSLARPRVEWTVWSVWAAGALVLAIVPAAWLVSTTLAVYVTAAAIGAYAVGAFLRHRRQTAPRVAIGFVGVALVVLAFGVHDVLAVSGVRLLPILLIPYTFTMIVLVEAVVVIARLLHAWEGLLSLNRELESRVASKSAELEQTWARVRNLEREQIVSDERRRITRDIHDGLGGHLVTTLAMLESEDEFSRDDVAEALRGALDDLRMVIDSLDPRETDVVGVLATIRSRLEPRLRRRGVRFHWDVADVAPSGLGPERLLRVLRIVQEAITNVLKHARATTITVRTGASDGHAWVSVGDDGTGFVPERAEGRGLVNMHRRATELGGQLVIDTSPAGTTVTLRLPST